MVFISDLLLNIFTIILTTVIVIIRCLKRRYSYWRNLGVECIEPTIPYGNFKDNIYEKISIGDWFAELYAKMKAKQCIHAGCYVLHKPIYVPIDLDLIKRIMQTDFAHFTDHAGYVNEKDDPLSATLFALNGKRWRNLRVKLTPTFTSGKMKVMFPIILKISQEFVETVRRECRNNPIDVKDVSARFTTDVIGNCAFGIDCNSLKDPNVEFRRQGRRIFKLTTLEIVKNFLIFTFPNLMRFFGTRLFPIEAADFFWNVSKDTAEYREKNGVRRDDAFQLLLDMLEKDGKENNITITFGELAAQAFIFFLGGFEASSSLISFALLELSLNEDVQDRLRKDVNEALMKNNGEITYETLFEIRYLDMVINETLRKYPGLPTLSRECTKDYQVPDSNVKLRVGDGIMIPIKGIHYDPQFYPDPQKFDPTRFTEENKSKRHQFAFLPFGEGPRICLGIRFGLMQAKVGLISMITNFRFKINPKTELPVKLDPRNFLTSALSGLWLDAEMIH